LSDTEEIHDQIEQGMYAHEDKSANIELIRHLPEVLAPVRGNFFQGDSSSWINKRQGVACHPLPAPERHQ
jgi:hypothetical protein